MENQRVTQDTDRINIVFIADQLGRAEMLRERLQDCHIRGHIQRLTPGNRAIQYVRQRGEFRRKVLPDLIICDFATPTTAKIGVLRDIAFGRQKVPVPVILLTSDKTEAMLEAGEVDGGKAVMFTPTTLDSFVEKLGSGDRGRFIKALNILYQYGPVLVDAPLTLACRNTMPEAFVA
jgi:CheY-like chemotaxis protein